MVIAQLSKSKAIYNTMVKSPDSGARNPELKSHFYHLIMMRPWTNQSLYLNFFNCKMEVMILPQKITVKIECINICQKKKTKKPQKNAKHCCYCTDPRACFLFSPKQNTVYYWHFDCFVKSKSLNFSSIQETEIKVSLSHGKGWVLQIWLLHF